MTETMIFIGIALLSLLVGAIGGFYLGRKFGVLASEKEAVTALKAELDAVKIDNARLEGEAKLNAEKESLFERSEKAFQELAEKALSEQREALTERGKKTFSETLKPFQEEMQKFQERIINLDKSTNTGRVELKTIIESLTDKTNTVSQEASELTKALKGDSQKRGAWGEIQLQRVLEMSGLKEGVTFFMQKSMQQEDEDGRRHKLRPDVVINLPDDRHLVIDAKLTLNSWIDASAAEDDDTRKAAEQRFLKAVEERIKELSGKSYERLEEINSLDFTLMYMPIEPAFLFVLEEKPELLPKAMEQHIMIVSPTTLLPILRIVEQIWRIDKQNRNTKDIVEEARKFYDKLVGFLETMEKIDKSLNSVRGSYDTAIKQLKSGSGNLISRAAKLKGLGVTQKKQIPASFQDAEGVEAPEEERE